MPGYSYSPHCRGGWGLQAVFSKIHHREFGHFLKYEMFIQHCTEQNGPGSGTHECRLLSG